MAHWPNIGCALEAALDKMAITLWHSCIQYKALLKTEYMWMRTKGENRKWRDTLESCHNLSLRRHSWLSNFSFYFILVSMCVFSRNTFVVSTMQWQWPHTLNRSTAVKCQGCLSQFKLHAIVLNKSFFSVHNRFYAEEFA